MAGFTKSGLTTAIQNYMENTETTFTATIPTFIQQAEEKILKTVQLPVFRKNVTGTGTASNTYLQMPSDFLSPFSLAVLDSSNAYTYLLLKHVSWIRDYTPIETTTGDPLFYAEFDNETFILAPTPSSAFTFELHYFYRPTSLTSEADDGTTWLATNASNTLLYGCLLEAAIFMKLNPQEIMLYDQKYQEGLAQLKMLGESKSVRDETRYDNLRVSPQQPSPQQQ
tara:strand:- start:911 stop:1585 length:675 start_codon:yes stop_codon:yes gene_type:complete